jgi:geranylgeranyl diphosphate synthase type II
VRSQQAYRQLLEQAMGDWPVPESPSGLYDPVRYIIGLGGKRLRPVLVLMAADLCGGRAEDALGPALAVEWFHNFSLLHDDIMDQAELRRGQPTVHRRFSANAAILSGDVMMVDSFRYLSRVRADLLSELLERFSRTAVEVCQGQQWDMDFEQRLDVTRDAYLEMIRLKTAVLLGFSLYAGARCGGADRDQAEALYAFGEQLGLAFQLRDDILDTYGDPERFGKTPGGDILQDKKTYLLIHALERSSARDRALLWSWLGSGDPRTPEEQALDTGPSHGQERLSPRAEAKIEAVVGVYARCGALEAAEQAVRDYHHHALNALAAAGLPGEAAAVCRQLAEELLERQH